MTLNASQRLAAPAMIPLIFGVAPFVSGSFLGRRRHGGVIAGLVVLQAGLLAVPILAPGLRPGFHTPMLHSLARVYASVDQWDWEEVYRTAGDCPGGVSRIAYIGGGGVYNRRQIEYPWVRRDLDIVVSKLWTNVGAPDWMQIERAARSADLVLTRPGYRDLPLVVRLTNRELAARLEADPSFSGPFHVEMGRGEKETLYLFQLTYSESVEPLWSLERSGTHLSDAFFSFSSGCIGNVLKVGKFFGASTETEYVLRRSR